MRGWVRGLRWAVVAAMAALLGGCPYECKDPVSYEVTEPSLGQRTGKLTWLQTGRETELSVTTTADAVTSLSCRPSAAVEYTLVSADGAIDESLGAMEAVNPDGTFRYDVIWLTIDSKRALDAGVAPEVPDLGERSPRLTLVLARNGESFGAGELRAVSMTDDIALAVVSFGNPP